MANFVERIQARRIDDKYSLVRKLGQGGFGVVYLGRNFDTGSEVALKMEHRDLAPSVLAEEYELYDSFQGEPGFPEVCWFGQQDDYRVMVMELLGPNLEDLFVFCGGCFSLKTTLMILDQMLLRFKALHRRGFLHRDVKPQNFLIGTRENGNIIYMTDFGLAQEFEPQSVERTNQRGCPRRLVGTARFASVRGHAGDVQSPWDDLESLGYMAIYFLRGRLPWQGLKAKNTFEKDRLIMESKRAQDVAELCKDVPEEFRKYMRLVKDPSRDELPDHDMLRRLFRDLAESHGIEYDNLFDWTLRVYFQQNLKQ